MPADMSYAALCASDEATFVAELGRSDLALRGLVADASAGAAQAGAHRGAVLGRWWRPPNAVLTERMATIAQAAGYRITLGDYYTQDPWIDGGAAPAAHVRRFHARWLSAVMRSGSIAVMHTPERAARRQTIDVVRALLPARRGKGLRAVTLTELADAVLEGHRRSGTADSGPARV
jgi:peptidoglycan/xylan/chitin deacetylase (PgdA/CDA1 family)